MQLEHGFLGYLNESLGGEKVKGLNLASLGGWHLASRNHIRWRRRFPHSIRPRPGPRHDHTDP